MMPEQETGKENMFVFGMDAEDVPAWREGKRHEWSDYDPRFVQALDMIMSGTFGDVEYFTVRFIFGHGSHPMPGLRLAADVHAYCKMHLCCTSLL